MSVSPEIRKKYIEDNKKKLDKVLEYYLSADWKLSSEKDDYKVWTAKCPDSSFSMLKSQCRIDGLYDKVRRNVQMVPRITPDMPDDQRGGAVERYTFAPEDPAVPDMNCFFYIHVESGSKVVSNRDFVMYRAKYEKDGRLIVLATGMGGEDLVEQKKGTVRGVTNFQAFILEGDTLSFVLHADPCGSVPATIYNMVCARQGETILNIRDMARKE